MTPPDPSLRPRAADRLRTLARRLGTLALGLAGSVFLAWLIGRLVGDRFLWSQFLLWIPTPLALLVSLVLLALWSLLRLTRPRPRPRRPARLAWGAWTIWALVSSLAEFHVWRLVAPPAPASPSIRVLVWNVSETYLQEFPERVASEQPDILVASTPPSFPEWLRVLRQFGDSAGAARSRYLALVSRYPVTRWGVVQLEIPAPDPEPIRTPSGARLSSSGGEAFFAELDTRGPLGRPLVVWAIDLPSDPRLHRRRMMLQARAAISAWTGPCYTRDAQGRDVPVTPDAPGFPSPDLLVGDLNTPRGSPSLGLLAAGMADAFDQAGLGWRGTFPRRWPLLAIDHVLVADPWHAVGYNVVDLGGGRHRAVIADIAPHTPGAAR